MSLSVKRSAYFHIIRERPGHTTRDIEHPLLFQAYAIGGLTFLDRFSYARKPSEVTGLEPVNAGIKILCLTIWRYPSKNLYSCCFYNIICKIFLILNHLKFHPHSLHIIFHLQISTSTLFFTILESIFLQYWFYIQFFALFPCSNRFFFFHIFSKVNLFSFVSDCCPPHAALRRTYPSDPTGVFLW